MKTNKQISNQKTFIQFMEQDMTFLPSAPGSNKIQKGDTNGGFADAIAGVDYMAPTSALVSSVNGQTGAVTLSIPSVARTVSTFTPVFAGTGATGTQASSTKDSTVKASFTTSTTVTLGGSPISLVTAKICPTNSATEASWTTVGLSGGSQPTTLSVTVGQQISSTGQIIFDLPAGWFYKFENSGTGTHAESVVSGSGQITIYG